MKRETPFEYRYSLLFGMAIDVHWHEMWFADSNDATKALEALQIARMFFARGKIKAAHSVLDQLDELVGISTYPYVEEE